MRSRNERGRHYSARRQGPEKVGGRYARPEQWLSFTYPINMTGRPVASAPAGWTDDGLPAGLQIVGRHLDDALVLRALGGVRGGGAVASSLAAGAGGVALTATQRRSVAVRSTIWPRSRAPDDHARR
jgi:hypothetical protein